MGYDSDIPSSTSVFSGSSILEQTRHDMEKAGHAITLKNQRITALEAENKALRVDADMFGWLEKNATGFHAVSDPDNLVMVFHGAAPARISYGRTLRDAIEAARKETP